MSYTNPILALEKQKQLLGLEYEAEREAFRVQTEARGIGRIMKLPLFLVHVRQEKGKRK